MASTFSSSTSAVKAKQFYSHFIVTLEKLQNDIDNAQTITDLDPILQALSLTRNELTKVTLLLPTHDRQLHEQNLSKLTQQLNHKRKALQPAKQGFTFKRKPKDVVEPSHDVKLDQPIEKTNSLVSSQTQPLEKPSSSSLVLETTHSSLSHLSNRTVTSTDLSLSLEELNDLYLEDLEGCIIDLSQSCSGSSVNLAAVQLRNLSRCILITPPIHGSVMLHHIHDSWLIIPECRQFRMHSSTNVIVCLQTTGSIVTIEDCQHIQFSNVPSRYTVQDGISKPIQVQDFDILLSSSQLRPQQSSLHQSLTENDPIQPSSSTSSNWKLVDVEQLQDSINVLTNTLSQHSSSLSSPTLVDVQTILDHLPTRVVLESK